MSKSVFYFISAADIPVGEHVWAPSNDGLSNGREMTRLIRETFGNHFNICVAGLLPPWKTIFVQLYSIFTSNLPASFQSPRLFSISPPLFNLPASFQSPLLFSNSISRRIFSWNISFWIDFSFRLLDASGVFNGGGGGARRHSPPPSS